MKAITIRQPYASLIACGAKTIETRPRSTNYRGRIAIHAGAARLHHGKFYMLARTALTKGLITREQEQEIRYAEVPFGAVVATAMLVDCVPVDDLGWTGLWKGWAWQLGGSPQRHLSPASRVGLPVVASVDERPFGVFTPGRFGLLLEDVKPIGERCPKCWMPAGTSAGDCDYCMDGMIGFYPIPARGQQAVPWNWDPT